MAGLPACDKEPWGAYAVGGIFARAQIEVQDNEVSRHIVEMEALNDINRVLVSNPMDILTGKYGMPDMSNSEMVRAD